MIDFPTYNYQYYIYFKPHINVYEILFPAFIEMNAHFEYTLLSTIIKKETNDKYLSCDNEYIYYDKNDIDYDTPLIKEDKKIELKNRLTESNDLCVSIKLNNIYNNSFIINEDNIRFYDNEKDIKTIILNDKQQIELDKILSCKILKPYIEKHEFVKVKIN